MNNEKIEKVFEVLESFCQNQNNCNYCPFQTLKDDCSFMDAAGEIPPTMYSLLEDKDES